MDLLDAVDRAQRLAHDRVAEIKPEQWSLRTPCPEWNVGGVARHIVIGMQAYEALLTDRWAIPEVQDLAQIGYDGSLPYADTIYNIGAASPIEDEQVGDSAQARLLHLFGRRA